MIGLLQERPPYVRFEIQEAEYRDNNGVTHTREVERVLVTPAGSKDVHVADAVDWIRNKKIDSQQDPPRFPPEWINRIEARFQQWKQGNEIPEDGTPIRGWPVLSRSEIARCITANILTVEDLAALNEGGMENLGMGARAMKDKAVAWLAEKAGTGHLAEQVAALKQQNTELTELVKTQGQQLQQAMSTLAAVNADRAAPRRRGRAGPPPEPLDDGPAIK